MSIEKLETAEEIAKYTKLWVDRYRNDPEKNKAEAILKLRVVFDDETKRIRVLDGNDLAVIFRNTLGKRRLIKLKDLLNEIDPNRYQSVKWELK